MVVKYYDSEADIYRKYKALSETKTPVYSVPSSKDFVYNDAKGSTIHIGDRVTTIDDATEATVTFLDYETGWVRVDYGNSVTSYPPSRLLIIKNTGDSFWNHTSEWIDGDPLIVDPIYVKPPTDVYPKAPFNQQRRLGAKDGESDEESHGAKDGESGGGIDASDEVVGIVANSTAAIPKTDQYGTHALPSTIAGMPNIKQPPKITSLDAPPLPTELDYSSGFGTGIQTNWEGYGSGELDLAEDAIISMKNKINQRVSPNIIKRMIQDALRGVPRIDYYDPKIYSGIVLLTMIELQQWLREINTGETEQTGTSETDLVFFSIAGFIILFFLTRIKD
jgi:hypothetical protein